MAPQRYHAVATPNSEGMRGKGFAGMAALATVGLVALTASEMQAGPQNAALYVAPARVQATTAAPARTAEAAVQAAPEASTTQATTQPFESETSAFAGGFLASAAALSGLFFYKANRRDTHSSRWAMATVEGVETPLAPEEPVQETAPPAPPAPKPRVKAQWFPFGDVLAPKVLDGELVGDVGFDPLGFAKDKKTLVYMREAELRHARLAMLAAVGWPLSELWHKDLAKMFGLESILATGDKAPSILNGGLSNAWVSTILVASIAIAGYLENQAMNKGTVFWNADKPASYVPGDLGFDPLNLSAKRGGDVRSMQLAELKNGRLAMIAITAYVFQELATGLPVVQQTPYLF